LPAFWVAFGMVANELGRRWICNDALFVENHKKAREVTTNDE